MVTDPFEHINRAEGEPEKVAELYARMKEMAAEVETELSEINQPGSAGTSNESGVYQISP